MNRTNIITLFLCARICSVKFAAIHITKFNVLLSSVQKGSGVEMKLFGCAVREERSRNMLHCYTVAVPLCGVYVSVLVGDIENKCLELEDGQAYINIFASVWRRLFRPPCCQVKYWHKGIF